MSNDRLRDTPNNNGSNKYGIYSPGKAEPINYRPWENAPVKQPTHDLVFNDTLQVWIIVSVLTLVAYLIWKRIS